MPQSSHQPFFSNPLYPEPEDDLSVSLPLVSRETSPVVRCRGCGQIMRARFQNGLLDRPGYYMITCDNQRANDGLPCCLEGFTLGINEYPTLDLTAYIKSGMKRREAIPNGWSPAQAG